MDDHWQQWVQHVETKAPLGDESATIDELCRSPLLVVSVAPDDGKKCVVIAGQSFAPKIIMVAERRQRAICVQAQDKRALSFISNVAVIKVQLAQRAVFGERGAKRREAWVAHVAIVAQFQMHEHGILSQAGGQHLGGAVAKVVVDQREVCQRRIYSQR
jgi:hypothetical protein